MLALAPTGVLFSCRRSPCLARYPLSFLGGLDSTPLMRAVAWEVFGVTIRETKKIGRTKFGISGAAVFGDDNKSQSDAFADRWRDGVPINSVVLKVLVGDRQPTIVVAAVVRHLDFKATEYPLPGETKHPICRRLQHLYQASCKLTAYRIPSLQASHSLTTGGTKAMETLMIV
jgi:hypothetical protein